jgi:CRISPR-associated exonuclease Cas4
MLKQMDYCPAIPWLITKTGWIEPPTDSMKIAREKADAKYKEEIAEKLGLPKPWKIEACLKDPETELTGCIDLIAGSKRLTIAEIKLYRRARKNHVRTQLLAYAYLANKAIAPVERAILIENGEIALDIPITREHLDSVRKKLEKLKTIINQEEPPTANPSDRQCIPCQYRKICPLSAI